MAAGLTGQARLGIDIGRVVIAGPDQCGGPNGPDTAFFDGDEQRMLATPAVPGAIEAIARLVAAVEGRVWLISQCGPWVEARTRRWLDGHGFFERTGMTRDHLRFCLARVDKRDHCLELGITHMVDDRPEVHAAIRDVVPHRYLFGPQDDVAPDAPAGGGEVAVATWAEAERLVRATLLPATGRVPVAAGWRTADC